MDQQLFECLIYSWSEYLTETKDIEFDKFLELSRKNRRIRNIFVLFVLMDPQYFEQFSKLVKQDKFVGDLEQDLIKALVRLEQEKDTELAEFGRFYRQKYFNQRQPIVEDNYDVSAEIAKLLKTILFSFRLAQSDSEEERTSRAERIRLLFHSWK